MIEIRLLTPIYEEEYRQFLLSNPYALIYTTVAYREFLATVAGGQANYLLAYKHGEVVGVLPYFRKTHPEWGTVINSLPWYGSYGGCTLTMESDDAVHRALLTSYAEACSASDVLAATTILAPFEHVKLHTYLQSLAPSCTDERIGQIMALPEGGPDLEQRLLQRLKQKTRNLVRKACRQAFVLLGTDEDWAWRFLYETHVENMQALGGRSKPWEHFVALRTYIPAQWRVIFVAMLANQPVAALLLLNFNKTVEYFMPVIKHAYRSQQPLSFLIWHAMIQASKDGYRWWNWGGTWLSQRSLYHFKAGWGAIDFPYTYMINVTGQAFSIIRMHIDALQMAFPYYYLFPYGVQQLP